MTSAGSSPPSSDGPTLRERKRAAARARVVDEALALFDRRGYAAVSVDEICAAAEVSPRSFFRYFPAKADVLLAPVREMSDHMEAAMAAAPPELDDADALDFALRRLARHVLDRRERFATFQRVASDTDAVRASPFAQLAERERAMTARLLARRGAHPPGDWRTRLLVARGVAAFRVWLEDLRTRDLADPLAHLDRILGAD